MTKKTFSRFKTITSALNNISEVIKTRISATSLRHWAAHCTTWFIHSYTFYWVYLSHSLIFLGPNCGTGQSCEFSFIHWCAWELRRIFCNVFLNLIVLQTRKSLQKRRFIPNTTASLPTHTFYGSKLRQNFKFSMVMLSKSPKHLKTNFMISKTVQIGCSLLNFHIKKFLFSKTLPLELRLQDLINLTRSKQNVLFFPHKM